MLPSEWPDGYVIISIFGHLEQWKFANKCEIFAKVGSQFCQILNSYSREGTKLFKLCLSGEILPNLVTLVNDNIIPVLQFFQFLSSLHVVILCELWFWVCFCKRCHFAREKVASLAKIILGSQNLFICFKCVYCLAAKYGLIVSR